MNNEKNSPFKHMCVTIGNLPSSYVESLSYYECLNWLYTYLNDTVINDINEISEATTELQQKFIELKSYVDNYFSNLDVQEEINNKLDEMAESGELAEIIAQYLNANCILAYNTIADMAVAENLVNGSFARTYGKLEYNDGLGNYYKIRNITSGDVIDGYNIVAITNDNTIIAERIPDNYLGNLNTLETTSKQVTGAINEVIGDLGELDTKIDTKISKRKFILVGDSYAEGYGNVDSKGWGKYLIEYLNDVNIEAQEIFEGGSGFVHVGNSGHTFKTLLESLTVDDPSSITDIVVIGGYNDKDSTIGVISAAIGLFVDYVKETYVNATVSIGMVGNNSQNNDTGMLIRHNLTNIVLPAYQACNQYGAVYLDGIENSTHNYNLFYSDYNHLTDYSGIAKSAFNILMGYGANVYFEETLCDLHTSGLPGFILTVGLKDNNVYLRAPNNASSGYSFNWNKYINITVNLDIPYMRYRFTNQKIAIPVELDITYSGGSKQTIGLLLVEKTGQLNLFADVNLSGVSAVTVGSFDYCLNTNNY